MVWLHYGYCNPPPTTHHHQVKLCVVVVQVSSEQQKQTNTHISYKNKIALGQISFRLIFFLTQKNFQPTFYLTQKQIRPKFFWPKKKFRPNKISDLHFVDPPKIQTQIFLLTFLWAQKKFDQNFFCLNFHEKFRKLPNNIEVRMKTTATKSTYISKTT